MSVTTTHPPSSTNAWAAALPMPPAPPVIRATIPWNSRAGGASESLYSSSGQYSIPNDSSSLERDEATEPGCAAHHGDRAQIEVAGQPGGLQRPAGADETDALDQHDARARVEEHVALGPILLEVGTLALVEGADVLDEALAQLVRRRRVSGRTRPRPAVASCGRGGRGRRRRPGRARRASRTPTNRDRRRAVDLKHARPVDRDRAAQRGQHLGEQLIAPFVLERRAQRPRRTARRRPCALRRMRRRG